MCSYMAGVAYKCPSRVTASCHDCSSNPNMPELILIGCLGKHPPAQHLENQRSQEINYEPNNGYIQSKAATF